MLGLILLYWIGKYFYKLAEEYNKSKWGYAILGIVVYYGSMIGIGIGLGITIEIFYPGFIETINETLLSILMLPIGILSCYIFYKYLDKTWKKNSPKEEINQIGLG